MISPISSGIKNGVIAGLATVILSLVLYFVSPKTMMSFAGYFQFIFVIVMMVLAGTAVRKSNDGYLDFGDAFKATWVTYAIYSLIAAIFTYVLYNIIDPGLADVIKEQTIETTKGIAEMFAGGNEDQMEEMLSVLEDQDYSMTIGKVGISFITNLVIGAIIAAIISLIIRKKSA